MTNMTPAFTAKLSKAVYTITDDTITLEQAITRLNNSYKGIFKFNDHNLLKAKTGGPGIIKCRTAFGFTLIGQGRLKGHAFILFRGTKFLADWLTNSNTLVSSSACGQPVHAGFNKTFNTMKPKVQAFVQYLQSQNIHSVHCIGHSLGGAIATICAEWIAQSYQTPYLYTFGSPRVGLMGFASTCTKRLGNKHIYRAYHKTDIVPFVPVWPFIHTPNRGKDYFLPSPGSIPGAKYHSMDEYIRSVSNRSWGALGARPAVHTNAGIERWLKTSTVIGFTVSTIEWLNGALMYVLRKCANNAAWIISKSFRSSFSLMDQIAYVLKKGLDKAKSISEWVVLLLNRIITMLGYNRSAVLAVEYNQQMIRFLFMKLQYRFNAYASGAINRALLNGKAI